MSENGETAARIVGLVEHTVAAVHTKAYNFTHIYIISISYKCNRIDNSAGGAPSKSN